MNDSHLAAQLQSLRQQIDDLQGARLQQVGKAESFSLPSFVTTQDEDKTRSLESAWMLGRGEEGQPNADADLLENYWLRVDRDPDSLPGISGRLDLRMNAADALLWCHAKGASTSSEFVTVADFGLGSFKIVADAADATSPVKFFQANLGDPATYLLTLQRDADKKCEATVSDSSTALALHGAAKIDIDTADVDGNDCRFHEWTQNGTALTPPLYVLSSGPGDLSLLPCVFQWDKTSGHLGVGTASTDTCPALAQLDMNVVNGLTLHAGGDSTGELTLKGGSGTVSLLVSATEQAGFEVVYGGGSQHINVVLGTAGSGIEMDFGGGLTVSLDSGDLAALGGGVHAVRFREVDICVDGVSKKMIVLGSESYGGSS